MQKPISKYKKKSLTNIKKAIGTLKKIIQMVEQDKYCIDIIQQNLAVIGLLKSANQSLLEGHLQNCFTNGIQSKNKKTQNKMIKEIIQINKLSNK